MIKDLHLKGRNYQGNMTCLRRNQLEAEVTYDNREGGHWRYPVNLKERTCSCMRWQITGKPCIHALFFLNIIRGEEGKVDPYVSEYFSVDKFQKTYEDNVPALLGKAVNRFDTLRGRSQHPLAPVSCPGSAGVSPFSITVN